MRLARIAVSLFAGTVAVASLSACGATTYEADVTVPVTEVAPTTLPSGPASDLLPRLSETMKSLSSYIGPDASQDTPVGKRDVLAAIDNLWAAARDEVAATSIDDADSIARMVDLAHTAVERNRPADADKAAKFASQVIDDFLAG